VNASATVLALQGLFKGMKWQYFERRSTTTKIVSNPLDLGKPVIKSKETSSQMAVGIGKGWSNPPGEVARYFCR
jgi:ribosomal protein L13E